MESEEHFQDTHTHTCLRIFKLGSDYLCEGLNTAGLFFFFFLIRKREEEKEREREEWRLLWTGVLFTDSERMNSKVEIGKIGT